MGLEGRGEPSEPNVLNRIARAERLEPTSLNWPARTCSPAPDPSEPVSAHPALLYPCPRTWPFRICVPELAHPNRLAGSAGRVWGVGCESLLWGLSCLRAPGAREVGAVGFSLLCR